MNTRYFRVDCPDYVFVFSVNSKVEHYMMPSVMPCICGQQHRFAEITAYEYDQLLDEDLDE